MSATQSLPGRPVLSYTIPPREISPPAAGKVWLEKEDLLKQWQEQYAAWTNWNAAFEKLAAENVYENDHLNELDLRQHRSGIYSTLAKGEELAAALYVLANKGFIEEKQVPDTMKFIDSTIHYYMSVLSKWHAPIEIQDDLPPDLVQGFQDVDAGRVFPLDKALTDPAA